MQAITGARRADDTPTYTQTQTQTSALDITSEDENDTGDLEASQQNQKVNWHLKQRRFLLGFKSHLQLW